MNGVAYKLVNNKKLEGASSVMRAITHPLRLKLIGFIDQNRKVNVNKIYKTLKMEQSVASQHLRVLRENSLVKAERNGKLIYYTVNYSKVQAIAGGVAKFLPA